MVGVITMISIMYIKTLENIPEDYIKEFLLKFSKYELEDTLMELNEFRNNKNQLKFPRIYHIIKKMLEPYGEIGEVYEL